MSTSDLEFNQPFRPRARVLQLLGDELIGSPRLAVFELVKNAYDADANESIVTLDLKDEENPKITVSDDGIGMSPQTIKDIWLVPGNNHRQEQRKLEIRTEKHERLPLGEKGLGRFAVHKLGNHITLITRAAGELECVVEINWNEIIQKPFLDEAPISVKLRHPIVFTGNSTGTKIEITDLRSKKWTRGDVRRLHKQITSICSPFETPEGFRAELLVPGHSDWTKDLLDPEAILRRAPWKFTFKIKPNGSFTWDYKFQPSPGINIEGRNNDGLDVPLLIPPLKGTTKKNEIADADTLSGIGEISGEFYIYDRDREILKLMADTQTLTEYLDENGGIRIYRDGVRVYNYGEPGEDWLGLDLRRVNKPTKGISNNLIIGAIHLSLKDSTGLVEKTNREGFMESSALTNLQRVVLGLLASVETERKIDKDRIRKIMDKSKDPIAANVERPIEELRSALKKYGVIDKFEPYIKKLEDDYHTMQETLLSAGMSGLNLAVVFHEVERGVRMLHKAIESGADLQSAADQARDLTKLLDGFSNLLKRDDQKPHSARTLITRARDLTKPRFRFHETTLNCPFLEKEEDGFKSIFAFGLVLNAVVNLIDNSIYWLQVRWPESKAAERKIYLGISNEFELGPALIIADNGPGFQDDPDNLVRPFFTRKPIGMGLGLYYANLAMELNGGILAFPEKGEVDLPKEFDGAVIALIFKDAK